MTPEQMIDPGAIHREIGRPSSAAAPPPPPPPPPVDKIITDEMVIAGLNELTTYYVKAWSKAELVQRIYQAMYKLDTHKS